MLMAAESAASTGSIVQGLLSIPLLIAANSLFVAAQFALVALRRTRVEEMQRQGVAGARAVAQAMDKLDRCVAATQLGTVLVGLLLGWLGEPAMTALLQRLFDHPGNTTFRTVSAVLTFTIITFLSVVFGELIPKTVGLQNSEGTALLVARPLLAFTWLVNPVVRLMDGAGNLVLRLFGYVPDAEAETPYSIDELTLLIDDSVESGVLTEARATFVKNLLRLSDKKVTDALVPIEKVGLLEYGAEPDVLLHMIRGGTFTRMPVYQGMVDNILGVANTKQLLRQFTGTGRLVLEEALYPTVFVAPTDTLPQALRALREARFPLALVRDPSGKVLGILTMEDILEHVIGNIVDEHDYPAPKVTPRMLQAMLKTLPKRQPSKTVPARVFAELPKGDVS
jgi:putative hemolysin